jgi:hypothetical protein
MFLRGRLDQDAVHRSIPTLKTSPDCRSSIITDPPHPFSSLRFGTVEGLSVLKDGLVDNQRFCISSD